MVVNGQLPPFQQAPAAVNTTSTQGSCIAVRIGFVLLLMDIETQNNTYPREHVVAADTPVLPGGCSVDSSLYLLLNHQIVFKQAQASSGCTAKQKGGTAAAPAREQLLHASRSNAQNCTNVVFVSVITANTSLLVLQASALRPTWHEPSL